MFWTNDLLGNLPFIFGGPWIPAHLIVESVDTDKKMLVMRNLVATRKLGIGMFAAEPR